MYANLTEKQKRFTLFCAYRDTAYGLAPPVGFRFGLFKKISARIAVTHGISVSV